MVKINAGQVYRGTSFLHIFCMFVWAFVGLVTPCISEGYNGQDQGWTSKKGHYFPHFLYLFVWAFVGPVKRDTSSLPDFHFLVSAFMGPVDLGAICTKFSFSCFCAMGPVDLGAIGTFFFNPSCSPVLGKSIGSPLFSHTDHFFDFYLHFASPQVYLHFASPQDCKFATTFSLLKS